MTETSPRHRHLVLLLGLLVFVTTAVACSGGSSQANSGRTVVLEIRPPVSAATARATADILRRRIDGLEIPSASVDLQGQRIVVHLSGSQAALDPSTVNDLSRRALLLFRPVLQTCHLLARRRRLSRTIPTRP